MTDVNDGKLRCPCCGSLDFRVCNSRDFAHSSVGADVASMPFVRPPYRRRHCNACGHRWSTIEVAIDDLPKFDTAMRIRAVLRIAEELDVGFTLDPGA